MTDQTFLDGVLAALARDPDPDTHAASTGAGITGLHLGLGLASAHPDLARRLYVAMNASMGRYSGNIQMGPEFIAMFIEIVKGAAERADSDVSDGNRRYN